MVRQPCSCLDVTAVLLVKCKRFTDPM
jgi:hypothetical protein